MPRERIAMHHIEEILRLRHEAGRTQREIAGGYGYSRFYDLYRGWRKKQNLVMRQEHQPAHGSPSLRATATVLPRQSGRWTIMERMQADSHSVVHSDPRDLRRHARLSRHAGAGSVAFRLPGRRRDSRPVPRAVPVGVQATGARCAGSGARLHSGPCAFCLTRICHGLSRRS